MIRSRRRKRSTAAMLSAIAWATTAARGQQLAFAGAEGAGKYAAGGRGGDVYFVTNLNDSGAGSLREGIRTATGPRTILFNVGGTIHLASNLDVNKPNLTIAGQSAPGGGITIADRMTRVVNTADVVLQHLRFRVGDTYTRNVDDTYEPDALWVAGSTNVIVDHVSASWSVDETLSVTHGSTNVTVQWSNVAQSLRNGGHSKGAHGYGSLINGGDITFHHNLYSQHTSRNPRPGDSSVAGQTTRLDFVNNVIANPGFFYGYSGADLDTQVNYVGNYGIDGPGTTAGSLFSGGGTGTLAYASGNYRDANKNGYADATPNSALGGTYTLAASRANVTPVATTDARVAYVQTMSRAGAVRFRDSLDRAIVRDAMQGTGAFVDSQAEVGGWPTLAAGAAPADANNDGVPDYYAVAQGYGTSANVRNVVAGNGYTVLQNYLASLTPAAYAPTNASAMTLRSAADATVGERKVNGVTTSTGDGAATTIAARYAGTGTGADRNEYALVRFDLSSIVPGSVESASLRLTAATALASSGHTLNVYGLIHDAAGFDWSEASATFADAPALAYDGDVTTRGLDAGRLYRLGTLSANGTASGGAVNFGALNLAIFLNLAAYVEAGGSMATLILERVDANANATTFYSREAGAALAPTLNLTAVAAPEPTILLGLATLAYGAGVRRRRAGS